jgi:hypothetical protein
MGYSIPSFAVSRLWFQEAGINRGSEWTVRESWRVNVCSFPFVFMMSTSYESFTRRVLMDPARSLNTGVSSRKDSGAANLGE